jgi:hypothetical protein
MVLNFKYFPEKIFFYKHSNFYIWDSHDKFYNVGVVLCFGDMWFSRQMPTFRGNMLSPFLGLKIVYIPTIFLPSHFSPEDGNSIFLRNIGLNLRNHTKPKHKTKVFFTSN